MDDDRREAEAGQTPPGPEAATPQEGTPAGSTPGWERELLTRLAFASLEERRRARRWGIFFKLAVLVLFVAALVLYLPWLPWSWLESTGGRHVALVDVRGVIAADSDASAQRVIAGLETAFDDQNTAGVIVRIDSPGGSPVQARQIHDAMLRLRKEHPRIPLYAVITDIGASGGYYVAVGAQKIFADPASVVGSIGVLMNGFGFVDAMQKLGIRRRLVTAGEHKGFLDPFSPEKPEEVAHLKAMLDEIHEQFIAAVRAGRGARLHSDPDLFSGYVWTGERAEKLGLIDAFGSSRSVARDVIGVERIVNVTPQRSYFERLAERLGASMARNLDLRTMIGRLRLE